MHHLKTTILLLCVLFAGCEYIQFAKAVSIESEQKLMRHKLFINSISFKGVVVSKDYDHSSRSYNRYKIKIECTDFNADTVNIGYRNYPPFYDMEGRIIFLSVSKHTFERITVASECYKPANSNQMILINRTFEILSKDEGRWFD